MTQETSAKKTVSPVGRRLAAYRKWRGLTAEQLAESIPSEAVTRGVIANVESGRKRDLTATELMLVASGLDISPIALLVDLDRPFDLVEASGLAASYSELTNAEYVFATSITTSEIRHGSGAQLNTGVRTLLASLLTAEGTLERVLALDAARADRPAFHGLAAQDDQGRVTYETPPFHSATVTETHLDDPQYRWAKQDLVDDYRDLLARLPGGVWARMSTEPTEAIRHRIERIRRRVVEAIEEDPTLDRSSARRPASEDPRGFARTIKGPAIDDSGRPAGSNYRAKTIIDNDGEALRVIYMPGDPDSADIEQMEGTDDAEYTP